MFEPQLSEVSGRGARQVVGRTEAELLPVEEYFHVVFTLPQQLAALALQNAKTIYTILFRSAWHSCAGALQIQCSSLSPGTLRQAKDRARASRRNGEPVGLE